jgi:hypothetical protein
MSCFPLVPVLAVALLAASSASARSWRDSTGKYAFTADLLASNDEQVVLKRNDGRLVAIETSQLSKEDQEYLRSEEAARQRGDDKFQTWTMKGDWKVVGRLVGYGRKDVVVQRRRGKLYVNDRLFDNLPEVYRRMLPRIVSHFEGFQVEDKKALTDWAVKLKGQSRKFVCDGVMLEVQNGDEYAVPFMFFSDEDLQVLKPGWDQWLANHENEARRQQEDFYLQAQAEAYQRDRQASQQIAAMQLALQAVDAGVTDLWEVHLAPKTRALRPQIVVVPARDSRQAAALALSKYPNHVAGTIKRLN